MLIILHASLNYGIDRKLVFGHYNENKPSSETFYHFIIFFNHFYFYHFKRHSKNFLENMIQA